MSYCRLADDSDVYVIGTAKALQCCGCSLFKYSFETRKYSEMLEHLKKHKLEGEKVPDRAFTTLKTEQTKYADKYPRTENGKLLPRVKKTKQERREQAFHRAMDTPRKAMCKESLELFEKIFKRTPTQLELAGIAEAGNIWIDLTFTYVCKK